MKAFLKTLTVVVELYSLVKIKDLITTKRTLQVKYCPGCGHHVKHYELGRVCRGTN